MQQRVKAKRKATVNQRACVACGCCVKVCPLHAIDVFAGAYARVNADRCVGCGRCAAACPASVIAVQEV